MIGINGQYILSFSIGDLEDFLNEADLIHFAIQEQAGNILPIFVLDIEVRDIKIVEKITEGNSIILSTGRDRDNLVDTRLLILSKQQIVKAYGVWMLRIKGCFDAFEYIHNPKIFASEKKSGVEVIQEIANKYFDLHSENLKRSSDSQIWLQVNESDSKFINDVWLHSYLPDSFIGVGINAKGEFIIRNMKKEAKNPRVHFYPFIQDAIPDDAIGYTGLIHQNRSSGFYNSIFGYKRNRNINTLEKSEIEKLEIENQTFLALTDTFDRKSKIKGRNETFKILTDNMHENYYKAFDQNLSYLSLFSSSRVQFSVWEKYIDVSILDCVFFHDNMESRSNGENYEGYYFIERIVREIDSKMYRTNIVLTREATNSIKGDLY